MYIFLFNFTLLKFAPERRKKLNWIQVYNRKVKSIRFGQFATSFIYINRSGPFFVWDLS